MLAQTTLKVKVRPVVLTATVSADKAIYAANESMTITSRVTADAASADAANLTVTLRVNSALGLAIFTQQQTVASLSSGASAQQSFVWPIANAAPGTYNVVIEVMDAGNVVLATKSTSVVVQSTADNGVGVTGTLNANPQEVIRGNTLTLFATLANTGNADIANLPIRVTVIDSSNATVRTLDTTLAVTRTQGGTTMLTWAVPSTQATGTYTARLTAQFGAGTTAAQLAQVTFDVKPVPTSVGSIISVNKPSYAPNETVTVTSRITNGAVSSPLTGASLVVFVLDPSNRQVFTQTQNISNLPVGANIDLTTNWAINNVVPGVYTIQHQVRDSANAILDTRTTNVTVQSTATTGFGVSASLTANPGEVIQGQSSVISAVLTNVGNADVASAVIKLSILSPTNQTVTTFDATTNISRTASSTVTQSWTVPTTQTLGDYRARLEATIGTTVLQLGEITLKVKPRFDVGVTQDVPAETRLLVLVSCQKAGQTSNGFNIDEPFCLTLRQNFITQYLTDLGLTGFMVTTSYDEFRELLRCGEYNTYWISGGGDKLKDRVVEEVREAVLRGDALLIDGARDQRIAALDEVVSVGYTSKLTGVASTAALSGALGTASIPVLAEFHKVVALTGSAVQARFSNADPAIVTDTYGSGKAAFFAFDLVGTLRANPTSMDLQRMLSTTLNFVKPTALLNELPRAAVLPFAVTLQNKGVASEMQIELTVPNDVAVVASREPRPTSATAKKVVWRVSLAAGEQLRLSARLTMPSTSTTSAINVKVFRVDGATLIETYSANTSLATLVGDQIKNPLIVDLNALTLTGAAKTARDSAVTLVNGAYAKVGQAKYTEAIADYLLANSELDKITTPSVVLHQTRVSRLIRDASKIACGAVVCRGSSWGAADYNLLVFGASSMSNSSIQGSLGVGGALSMSSYSVASALTGDAARMYVAGTTSAANGSIGNGTGLIRVGGVASIPNTFTRRVLTTNVPTDDFSALKSWYTQLSSKTAQLTGVVPVADGFGKFTFTGTNETRNVFTIAGTQLALARNLVFNVPDTSTVVVNVTGASAVFTNGRMLWGTQSMGATHPRAPQILFNFPQATNLSVSSFSPVGTLLAPNASLSHANATIHGQAVVNLFSGTGGFTCVGSFRGSLPTSTQPVQ
jgi:choice-of-anchor A domain-containing protein